MNFSEALNAVKNGKKAKRVTFTILMKIKKSL